VKEAAAWALAEIAGAEAVPALAGELVAPEVDPGVAWTTIDALGRLGTPAVTALVERLRSPHAAQRQWAATALAAMRLDGLGARSELLRLADAEAEAAVQLAAVKALVAVAPIDAEIEALLNRILARPTADRAVCQAAGEALDRLPHTSSYDPAQCKGPYGADRSTLNLQWTARCEEDPDTDARVKALLSFTPVAGARPLRLVAIRTVAGQVIDRRAAAIADSSVTVSCRETRATAIAPIFRLPLVHVEYAAMYRRPAAVTEVRWVALADLQAARVIVRLPVMLAVRRQDGGGAVDQVSTVPFPDGRYQTAGVMTGLHAPVRMVPPRDTDFLRVNWRVAPPGIGEPLVVETDSLIDGPWQRASGAPLAWGGTTRPMPKELLVASGFVRLSEFAPSNPADAEKFWRAQLQHPLMTYRGEAVAALARQGAKDLGDDAAALLAIPSRGADLMTEVAATLGPSAIPDLERLLRHPIPEIARRGAFVLNRMKPTPIDALRAALRDPQARVAVLDVVRTHAGVDVAPMVPELVPLIGVCGDLTVVGNSCWQVMELIGRAGMPAAAPAVPALRALVEASDDPYREGLALRTLIRLGDREFAWPRLTAQVSGSSSSAAADAMALLASTDAAAARPILVPALSRSEIAVRMAAAQALARMAAPEAVAAAATWAQSADVADRTRALTVLENIRTPQASALLAALAADRKRAVRDRAAGMLKSRGLAPPR
jgi:HEAT repeat protein